MLRVGLLFEIPFPFDGPGRSSFRLTRFSVARDAYAIASRDAHPLEANFVSGSGVCGCYVPMEEFCQTAVVTGYYPHHPSDGRKRQFNVHAKYEEERGLPPVARQMLEALDWEGWFTLDELRRGEPEGELLRYQDLLPKLTSLGAGYILTRNGFLDLDKWTPCGSAQDLFLYEMAGDRIIEHLNPESPLADCGVKPGAWIWSVEDRWPKALRDMPPAHRIRSEDGRDRFGGKESHFFLDRNVALGRWGDTLYGESWHGNLLCRSLGLNDYGGGSSYECQLRILKQVAPYRVFNPDEDNRQFNSLIEP